MLAGKTNMRVLQIPLAGVDRNGASACSQSPFRFRMNPKLAWALRNRGDFPVNLNTAPPVVLYASVAGLSLADAKRLSDQRAQNPWSGLDAFQKAAGKPVGVDGTHSVNSRFFEVVGRLRMHATSLWERSVVQRDQVDVKVLWRESGSLQ